MIRKSTRQRVDTKLTADAVGRLPVVDLARGGAILMMIAYHFCFDLVMFRHANWNILGDPRWIAWRTVILSSFLVVAGLATSIRMHDKPDLRSFMIRWLQVAGAALLVTLGSAVMFPQSYIYFGVLHHMALAMIVCRFAHPLGRWNIALGLVIVVAGIFWKSALFEHQWVNWLGFMTHKPVTQDYVPVFPWLGVMLIGFGLGALWIGKPVHRRSVRSFASESFARDRAPFLQFLGRNSLLTYLVHQPLLIGILWLIEWMGLAT
jgi:uncharacterized membrane protein